MILSIPKEIPIPEISLYPKISVRSSYLPPPHRLPIFSFVGITSKIVDV